MSTQAPEIDGVVLVNDVDGDAPQPGQMRKLRITETHDYDIIGTLLPATEIRPEGLPLHAFVPSNPNQTQLIQIV